MFHLNAKEEIARACIMVFQSITEIRFLYILLNRGIFNQKINWYVDELCD
jgi:hypothetical protein